MRPSNKRSRSKQNRPRTLGNIVNRVFDSSGPEGKVRGTPQQIIDKYQVLARDAQLSGDRVAAENFTQHAEHYTRMLNEAQAELAREAEQRREQQQQHQQNHQNRRSDQPEGDTGDGGEPRGEARTDARQENRPENREWKDRRNSRRDDRKPRREGGEATDPREDAGQDSGDDGSMLVETPESRGAEAQPEPATDAAPAAPEAPVAEEAKPKPRSRTPRARKPRATENKDAGDSPPAPQSSDAAE